MPRSSLVRPSRTILPVCTSLLQRCCCGQPEKVPSIASSSAGSSLPGCRMSADWRHPGGSLAAPPEKTSTTTCLGGIYAWGEQTTRKREVFA
ncbi:hypothetical protein DL89DRAFT_270498, partial [Linderina pennispora]